MQAAAAEAGVQIVAGDTKVVQRGKADGLYINTAGVGIIPPGVTIGGAQARPATWCCSPAPSATTASPCWPRAASWASRPTCRAMSPRLNHLVERLLDACPGVHVLRDPTRGGLGTTLNEIARQSGVCIEIEEQTIPVRPQVTAACEMLGFDPLYIANEGKLVAIVARRAGRAGPGSPARRSLRAGGSGHRHRAARPLRAGAPAHQPGQPPRGRDAGRGIVAQNLLKFINSVPPSQPVCVGCVLNAPGMRQPILRNRDSQTQPTQQENYSANHPAHHTQIFADLPGITR